MQKVPTNTQPGEVNTTQILLSSHLRDRQHVAVDDLRDFLFKINVRMYVSKNLNQNDMSLAVFSFGWQTLPAQHLVFPGKRQISRNTSFPRCWLCDQHRDNLCKKSFILNSSLTSHCPPNVWPIMHSSLILASGVICLCFKESLKNHSVWRLCCGRFSELLWMCFVLLFSELDEKFYAS